MCLYSRTVRSLSSLVVLVVLFVCTSAGGARAQCDGIPRCTLVWSDEFNGLSVDTNKWEFLTGDGSQFGIPGWGNNELQWYQAANASVSGGTLTIEARQQSVGGKAYTSSRLRTRGMGDFLYGRFEMRARLPVGKGMWPAFWMLPTDSSAYGVWAASGEIDIMESIGGDTIYGTIHFGDTAPGNQQSGSVTSLPAGGAASFHEYAVEWEPGEIRWYLDDQLYGTKTSWFSTGGAYPAPFDVDFHLLLNLAVGGNFPGNPDGSTVFPQQYVIDYVRVYQEAPADPVLAAKCESTKVKAAGQYAKCVSGVYARAVRREEAADAVRLTKCAEKLGQIFLRAETKADGSCPTVADASAIAGSLDLCSDQAVADLGGAPGAGGIEAKCQQNKVKEAGKYTDCLFKASSKAIRKGVAPDFARCGERFLKKWLRLESDPERRPCSTSGDSSAIRANLDDCHASVTASLAEPACGNATLDADEECDDGNTTSGDGCSAACEIEPEYSQDFEGLSVANGTALADDGWWVFGNVFQAGTGNYLYGYGKFTAPNGGNAFSALVDGQGGAEQGTRQLSIYSDYDNGDHGNGHTIESNVFRERTIVAADVGKTIEFSFDAKAGNIGGATVAQAFLKTLNPNAGFATTNFVVQETTSLPAGWSSYSIRLDIDAGLEGQLLQYGFLNKATNYQGSGVYYDNVVVVARPTP